MKIFFTCIAMCIFLLSIASADPASMDFFKSDGSLQCDVAEGLSLDRAREELEAGGVDILGAIKRHDGKKRIAMCGAPTGQILVITIAPPDFEKAGSLGYERLD